MRNIAFLVIIIVTVAIAVSCNVQNSADSDGSKEQVSEKQDNGSVESKGLFNKIIKHDNDDILTRINKLEEQLNQRIDGINVSIDNQEVLTKLDEIKLTHDKDISDINTAIFNSDNKHKALFYQLLGAIFASMTALLLVIMLVYRYLKKFIAECLIIYSHKNKQSNTAEDIHTSDLEENTIISSVNKTAAELNSKINDAKYLFDPEKSLKLDNSQRTMLSEINTESAFLKKAGYEISSKHKYLTALEKVNDKNYTEAGQILDEIKTSDDTFGSAFFLSGYMAYVARKYETAIESLRRACELEPENAAYLVSYGNACLKEKKYDDASQALKKAVEIKPDDASAWNNLAHSYIVSDKIDDAVMAFSKATELKPDFHEALHNLGLALGKLKRYEEAADAFTKAIAVKDDKHESMYNAACVYALLGKREGALSNLKAAIAIQPEYAAKAKKDKDFSSFKNDDEFNAITG